MIVDIDKIVVRDRIRKDFGDIEALAEDIKTNGLINPPTINKEYRLLAGERRLRACKSLGWTQIEVHMLDTKDEAHDLNVEMSENNMRRNFTYTELADGIRRQMAIESEKAKARMVEGGGDQKSGVQTFANPIANTGRARDAVGEAFGISGEQVRKTLYVDDNRDMLDPADFADWDEGKLSTNKAYQKIKAAQREAEDAKARAERERDQMQQQVESLKRQVAEKPAPEVIEREVVREVVPDDYNELKKRVPGLENENRRLLSENSGLRESNLKLNKEIEQKDELLGERERDNGANRDVEQLINNIYALLNRHGGKSRAFDQFYRVEETTRQECRKALTALGGFAQSLLAMTDETNRLGA